MPEIKVIKCGSLEDAMKIIKSVVEDHEKEDVERETEEVEERYDHYIDVTLDYVECVIGDGEFKRDCELFRARLHKQDVARKRAFFRNFTICSKELITDIMGLVAENLLLEKVETLAKDLDAPKKTGSKAKENDKKVKDKRQTKKAK